jgi:hypothetical protein
MFFGERTHMAPGRRCGADLVFADRVLRPIGAGEYELCSLP